TGYTGYNVESGCPPANAWNALMMAGSGEVVADIEMATKKDAGLMDASKPTKRTSATHKIKSETGHDLIGIVSIHLSHFFYLSKAFIADAAFAVFVVWVVDLSRHGLCGWGKN